MRREKIVKEREKQWKRDDGRGACEMRKEEVRLPSAHLW